MVSGVRARYNKVCIYMYIPVHSCTFLYGQLTKLLHVSGLRTQFPSVIKPILDSIESIVDTAQQILKDLDPQSNADSTYLTLQVRFEVSLSLSLSLSLSHTHTYIHTHTHTHTHTLSLSLSLSIYLSISISQTFSHLLPPSLPFP